ncbi:MAG: PTS sugar transporter subunit IIA [Simkaniaceae bacterium]|nr:PTS sugar transporter subunit IIA [Candidatus Sacchlamyda saccharinae]
MGISDYLDEKLVMHLDVHGQNEALEALVNLLEKEGKLHDKQAFYESILDREKIVSTGIGIGVAIPHAKLQGYDEFFVAIGIQKDEGIEWRALDGLPVRLIFMIGGPEDQQTEYLNILSMITTAIKDEECRKALLSAKSPRDVVAIFEEL